MQVFLRHGVYLCLLDEGAVFLDLTTNAYLGIDKATRQALTRCLAGLVEPADVTTDPDDELPKELAALLTRGLITDSASSGRTHCPLTLNMTHAVPFGAGRANTHLHPMHLMRFFRAFIRASILIRRGRLDRLTGALMALKVRCPGTTTLPQPHGAVALVHIARRLSTLCYTSKDACVLDSMVLAEFLIRHGHRPTVVLGVRTRPFSAHAWVQLGTLVLNDSVEHASTLTPIAAL